MVLYPYARIHLLVPLPITLISNHEPVDYMPAGMLIFAWMVFDTIMSIYQSWFGIVDIENSVGFTAHVTGYFIGIFTAKILKKNDTYYDFFHE